MARPVRDALNSWESERQARDGPDMTGSDPKICTAGHNGVSESTAAHRRSSQAAAAYAEALVTASAAGLATPRPNGAPLTESTATAAVSDTNLSGSDDTAEDMQYLAERLVTGECPGYGGGGLTTDCTEALLMTSRCASAAGAAAGVRFMYGEWKDITDANAANCAERLRLQQACSNLQGRCKGELAG